MAIQTNIRPIQTRHHPIDAEEPHRVSWPIALLVVVALALITTLLVAVQTTDLVGPTRVVTAQEPNANDREGRMPTAQLNANDREGRMPTAQLNANDRESRILGDR